MSSRFGKKRKRNKRSLSFTSITDREKQKISYASKFTSSDRQLRAMLKQYERSKQSSAESAFKDGRKKRSIGDTLRKQRIEGSSRKSKESKAQRSTQEAREFPDGKFQLQKIGVLERKQRNDEILIDYDMYRTPKLRSTWVDLRLWELCPSYILDVRTKHGWHRIIRVRKSLLNSELIAASAILGSDKRRESLNLMRALSIRTGDVSRFARSRWNLLFERKL